LPGTLDSAACTGEARGPPRRRERFDFAQRRHRGIFEGVGAKRGKPSIGKTWAPGTEWARRRPQRTAGHASRLLRHRSHDGGERFLRQARKCQCERARGLELDDRSHAGGYPHRPEAGEFGLIAGARRLSVEHERVLLLEVGLIGLACSSGSRATGKCRNTVLRSTAIERLKFELVLLRTHTTRSVGLLAPVPRLPSEQPPHKAAAVWHICRQAR
jgi:hypothetical protein